MAEPSKSPIFIGGFFKSGTTLLRAMLGQHSAIASGLETQWFSMDWDRDPDRQFYEHVERLRRFYGLDEGLMNKIVAESRGVVHFLNRFMGHYAGSLGKRRWAEKTPGNVLHMERIYSGWPDAKIIHVVRDPRDTFASLKKAKKWDTIEEFVRLWSLFLGSAEKCKRDLNLDQDRYLEIRYEHLASRPREMMARVLEFLNEAWEEAVAEFKGREDEFHKVLEVTGKASTTLERLRKPLTKKRIGIWREIVSQDEIDQIHSRVEREGLLPLMSAIEDSTLIEPGLD